MRKTIQRHNYNIITHHSFLESRSAQLVFPAYNLVEFIFDFVMTDHQECLDTLQVLVEIISVSRIGIVSYLRLQVSNFLTPVMLSKSTFRNAIVGG